MHTDDLPLSRTTLNRDTVSRADPQALHAASADPRVRTMYLRGGRILVDGERDALVLTPARGAGLRRVPIDEGTDFYLGRDDDGPLIARSIEQEAGPGGPLTPPGRWLSLRDVGALLPARDAGVATAAVALHNWRRTHTRCPRCGTLTELTRAGWVQRCPRDGSEHYPRTDPAVIMSIVDPGDRLLLAHNALWPATRYSVPAGYVEPGESLEAAVRREVLEETAVIVTSVHYEGSQPWPFPASLMVAFRGTTHTEQAFPDGEELTKAAFFNRSELREQVLGGQLLLPTATSIAHSLIQDWYGEPLPFGDVTRT